MDISACMYQHPDGLPIVLYLSKCESSQEIVDRLVSVLVNGYRRFMGEAPSREQLEAWRGSLSALLNDLKGLDYPVIIEYPILGGLDRVDFIIVGSGRAIVVEAKGWRRVDRRGRLYVVADGKVESDPCYQVDSYVSKLSLLHSASSRIKFEGLVYLYNMSSSPSFLNCNIAVRNGLREVVEGLPLGPGIEEFVTAIINGRIVLSEDLISLVRRVVKDGLGGVAEALSSRGYGLVGSQAQLIAEVLSALDSGESGLFYLVEGTSGSGKTLVALTLFLEAIARGYKALLGYVNNRLVYSIRSVLAWALGSEGQALSKLVGFSAVGSRGYRGFCESRHDYTKYGGGIDLLVLDEAQRLPTWAVESCPTRPARVIVAFYDDRQILLGREAGTGPNLEAHALRAGRRVRKLSLPAPARVPRDYLEAVKSLLWGESFEPKSVEVRVFDNIQDMLDELRKRHSEGARIALICAFTESEGDRENPLSWESIKNIRIGYPLQSGFDLYKGLDIKVKWLMDEKKEYPLYWRRDYKRLAEIYGLSDLDPVTVCSSVYGAQGMEAEYVGVVWGRDLVWRSGGWRVNPEPITDNIGGRMSLKSIARKDPKQALELLRNRYYIMLTRATRGVYLFFEDAETREHVKQLLSQAT